jgi:adenosylhomocysteine nucleosidase
LLGLNSRGRLFPHRQNLMSAEIKLAIVAALEREVRPLIRHWRVREQIHATRTYRFYEHEATVVVCGGIATEAARRATEAAISLYAPDKICSAGFAGALDPKLKVGNLLEPRQVINFADSSRIESEQLATASSGKILITFNTVATSAQKRILRESYSADAVDMEAAAVARAAEVRGIPFAVIKVISDEVDFIFPSTERFVDLSGQFRETQFALYAALRPWLWSRLIQLAHNSSRASRALCARLEQLIADQGSGSENESKSTIGKSLAGKV